MVLLPIINRRKKRIRRRIGPTPLEPDIQMLGDAIPVQNEAVGHVDLVGTITGGHSFGAVIAVFEAICVSAV